MDFVQIKFLMVFIYHLFTQSAVEPKEYYFPIKQQYLTVMIKTHKYQDKCEQQSLDYLYGSKVVINNLLRLMNDAYIKTDTKFMCQQKQFIVTSMTVMSIKYNVVLCLVGSIRILHFSLFFLAVFRYCCSKCIVVIISMSVLIEMTPFFKKARN